MSDAGSLENLATKKKTLFSLLSQLRLSDAFLSLYVIVLARQFFWGIESNAVGWILAGFSTAAIVVFLRGRSPGSDEKLPAAFYLIVVLPLVAVFLCRLPFPDMSFDVLSYHHIYAERSINGTQFIPGDFFPFILVLNPAPDTLTGIFRHALGYRLGTAVGPCALIWTGAILFRMLAPYLGNMWLRAGSVLAILLTEQIFLLAGSYMVDVLVLPLILEATRRVLEVRKTPETVFDIAFVAILLGISSAFKLTNLAFTIPPACVYLVTILRQRSPLAFVRVSLFAAMFLLPLSAHALYVYLRLGNPIFPAYNALFRSPYFPPLNFRDGRFGPLDFLEGLVFPITSLWQAPRLNELHLNSGRIALGVVCAILCLWIARKNRFIFTLALVTIFSSLLWSYSTGYGRYHLALEVFCGLCVVCLIVSLTTRTNRSALPRRIAAAAAIMIAFGLQLTFAGIYFFGRDWSGRSTALHYPRDAAAEMRYLLRDRDLRKFQAADSQNLIDQVEVWVLSDIKTGGVEALLKNEIPIINVFVPEVFSQPHLGARTAALALFERTLLPLKDRRIYSLCYAENLDKAVAAIERAGFKTGAKTPLRLRFYSDLTVQQMMMIEVLPAMFDDRSQALKDDAGGTSLSGPMEK